MHIIDYCNNRTTHTSLIRQHITITDRAIHTLLITDRAIHTLLITKNAVLCTQCIREGDRHKLS